MIKVKPLVISLLISLGTGTLSGLLTMNSMDHYKEINKPVLSPPGFLFPIVWGILFTLMGISAYMIYVSDCKNRKRALTLYGIQLGVNFVWPLIFFIAQEYLIAFIWLVALWILVFFMIIMFYRCKPLAGYLQIPYLIWLTFAGYLNIMIFLLNR